ncbi:four helix bundle protein [Myroides sp. JBRI-B21084]|nr:four helix bundle protein [Paenimyroides cloacae]WKW45546.1 four helix bundle protein [Paenimyroides cloacae]
MEKYRVYAFEKLDIYKLALSLSVEVRTIVKSFPKEEQFDLTR